MSANSTFYKGGGPGRRTALTPRSASAQTVKRIHANNHALGTGAVSATTIPLFVAEIPCRILAASFTGTSAVTGTSLPADLQKRATDGTTVTSLLTGPVDLKLTSGTINKRQPASLSTTASVVTLATGEVLEAKYTPTGITAGPGYVTPTIVWAPAEDTPSAGAITTGADLGL